MIPDADTRHRRSIRLKGYDYSDAGAYFVTICTQMSGRDKSCPCKYGRDESRLGKYGRDESRPYLFGDIVDGEMRLNAAGKMVRDAWDGLPAHYRNVELDAFVVMPNHVHGIIILGGPDGGVCRGAIHCARDMGGAINGARTPSFAEIGAANRRAAGAGVPPLGEVVRAFKAISARRIHQSIAPDVPVWQRNYYEQIIRDENSMHRVRNYIMANPARWQIDRDYGHDTAPNGG